MKSKAAGTFSLIERQAVEKLLKAGVLEKKQDCMACGDMGIRPRNTDTFRCRACGAAWSLRRGSVLEGTTIPYHAFVRAIRLFATDTPLEKAALSLHQDHDTVRDMYARIRQALNGTGGDPRAPADKGIPARAEREGGGKGTVIFGIRSDNGGFRIERLATADPSRLIRQTIPEMVKGNVMFINAPGMQYQGFFLYEQDRNGHELIKVPARDEHTWSPLGELWHFSRMVWMRHLGMERKEIPAFLQDLAFRYNNRHQDLETVILQRLAAGRDQGRYAADTANNH
jgi:transposase-like protein